jgi:hypothetical protein
MGLWAHFGCDSNRSSGGASFTAARLGVVTASSFRVQYGPHFDRPAGGQRRDLPRDGDRFVTILALDQVVQHMSRYCIAPSTIKSNGVAPNRHSNDEAASFSGMLTAAC